MKTKARSILFLSGFVALGSLTGLAVGAAKPQTGTTLKNVTFMKDVLPILQRNCQTCHRPGEIGPMSFMSYPSTRPWAKAIKTAVVSRKMPPWFADPHYGNFRNEKHLTETEIETLAAWADGGAPEGDAADGPPPIVFVDGWNIRPDLVLQLPKPIKVPAKGTIEYTYVAIQRGHVGFSWRDSSHEPRGNAPKHSRRSDSCGLLKLACPRPWFCTRDG